MDKVDQKPAVGSAEELLAVLNIPFDIIDKVNIFLSTHPLPQGVIRAFHNMGI